MKTRTLLHGIFQCLTVSAALFTLTGCQFVVKRAMLRHPEVKKRLDLFKPDYTVSGRGWTNSVGEGTNKITVLHLDVTNHYSQGYWHGKLLAPQIKGTIDDLYLGANKLVAKSKVLDRMLTDGQVRGLINDLLDRAWKIMEPYVPQTDLDEMKGLADGLKAAGYGEIDLKTIHRVHAFPDVTETSCSAVIACGSATSDGHVYQIRILDYGAGSGLDKRPLVTVYHPAQPHENTFIAVGYIGFVGLVTGSNDKGVCISEMGFGNPPGETLAGEPMIFLIKRALRYGSTAEEVAAIIRSARRNNSYAYWVGDRSGSAIGMVTSARDYRSFRVNEHESISADVNGKLVTLPQFRDIIYAGHQREKQTAMIKEFLGSFNVERLKEHAKQIGLKSNLQATIFDLTTGDTYIANRHGKVRAVDCEYVLLPKSAWEK